MSLVKNAQAGQSVVRFFQFVVMTIAIGLFSTAAMAEKVNLNQADEATLQYIPGIGPSKSSDIVKVREQAGGFKQYEDLLEVPGIGEKTLEEIKKYGLLDGGVSELTQEMQDNPPSKKVSATDSSQSETSS